MRKVDGNENIIFAELKKIQGAIVVYRKPSERLRNFSKKNVFKGKMGGVAHRSPELLKYRKLKDGIV